MAREFSFFSSENKQQGGGGAGKIYKLVGPVLLAQDKSEAIMAVKARLEFIEKEMYVLLFLSFSFPFFAQRRRRRRRPEGPKFPALPLFQPPLIYQGRERWEWRHYFSGSACC